MKIAEYEVYKVPPRWLFLKIKTTEGIVGWGEPVVEGRADTVKAAVIELMQLLKGKDVLNSEDIWNMLYRSGFYRGGPILMSAISGIDQALWDIRGKYFGAPVHQLLGGASRDKIEVYSWVGGDEPEIDLKEIGNVVARGFKTIKINGTGRLRYIDSYEEIDLALTRIGKLRDKFGMSLNIAVDFHGRVHLPMAKILVRELEEFKPIFIEEPLLSEHLDSIRDLSRISRIPIALGERLYSRWDFKKVFQDRVADIIQPDLSHAGGITECKKIASMAETYDIAVAPHCPLGPIALAACLQLDGNVYNAVLQEQSLGIHYNETNDLLDYLEKPEVFAYSDGFVKIPKGPGLGIEINEDYVKKMSETGHNWHNPVWRHNDNSIAEW